MGNLRYVLSAVAFAGAVATGCSSSSNNTGAADSGFDSQAPPGKDSGPRKDTGPGKDTGPRTDTGPGKDSGQDVGVEASFVEGPCNFATFVKGLIANDTTATALPSTDLGASCTDDMDQSEFSTLFM